MVVSSPQDNEKYGLFSGFLIGGIHDYGILLVIPLELQGKKHQPFSMAQSDNIFYSIIERYYLVLWQSLLFPMTETVEWNSIQPFFVRQFLLSLTGKGVQQGFSQCESFWKGRAEEIGRKCSGVSIPQGLFTQTENKHYLYKWLSSF